MLAPGSTGNGVSSLLTRPLQVPRVELEIEFPPSESYRNFFSGLPFVFQAKAPALEVGIKGPPVLLVSSSVFHLYIYIYYIFIHIFLSNSLLSSCYRSFCLFSSYLFLFFLSHSFSLFLSILFTFPFAILKCLTDLSRGDYLVKCVHNPLSLTIRPIFAP